MGAKRLEGKRLGGKTTRGGNGFGAKHPGTATGCPSEQSPQ